MELLTTFDPADSAAANANAAAAAMRAASVYADDFLDNDFSRVEAGLQQSSQLLEARIHHLADALARADHQRQREQQAHDQIAVRLETLLDVLPAAVIVLDTRGRVCQHNPAALALLECELLGESWSGIIRKIFVPRSDDGHEISLANGRRVRVATASLPDHSGQLVLLTDLTETRSLQQQLARDQRLRALGEMVSALAHQIRTPLSAAMLYASQLSQQALTGNKAMSPEKQQTFLARLLDRLHNMESQIRDMLLFVRGEVPCNDQINQRQLLSALRSTLTPILQQYSADSDSAQCRYHGFSDAILLRCHRDALTGAIANLVHNALEAGASLVDITATLQGAQLLLCITDNGSGMDHETLAKAQDVFFTRKAGGTGLGLAIVNTVVQAHGGRWQLSSVPGAGTSVQILLPLVVAEGDRVSKDDFDSDKHNEAGEL